MTNEFDIKEPLNFCDYLCRLAKYKHDIAFCVDGKQYSYGMLLSDTASCLKLFPGRKQKILINTNNKYFFAVALFATVISGNVACLQEYSANRFVAYVDYDIAATISDQIVLDCIGNNYCDSEEATNETIDTIRGLSSQTAGREMAVVLCSSGTHSVPKAVALSQKNIMSNLAAGMRYYEYRRGGKSVSIIPFSHVFGLVCDFLAPLYGGCTIVTARDIISFFSCLRTENPTFLNVTPGLIHLMIDALAKNEKRESVVGKRLYKMMCGGAGIDEETISQCAYYGIDVYSCYGLTECTCGVALNGEFQQKIGSAGPVLGCNAVTINEDGIICVSGSNVMLGYLDSYGNLPEEPPKQIITNDIGYLDKDGILYVQGRVDDLLVFEDGTKLFPQEIERALIQLDGVTESMAYLDDNRLTVDVSISKLANVEIIRNAIYKCTVNGHKIDRINICDGALQRTTTGKLKRKK